MNKTARMTAQLVMRRADGSSILEPGPVAAESAARTEVDLPANRIAQIRRLLETEGLTVESGNANTLSVSGPAAVFDELSGLDAATPAAEATEAAMAPRIRADLVPFVAAAFVPPPEPFR